ncbi:hypothetical protein GCM10022215_24800 [Nocardioides fonticola]|uniref:Glycosyltransferase 2-like domain-containing protein n=1 Tax=Nocardioides fonticola TaxID=450363 RepID=A0ABP7XKH0_9ACTN
MLSTTRRRPTALSVVVPAFNVDRYLPACLTSVLEQSHRDLEVIVIDDGSTDRTGEIADRFAAADPRVRVVHQANAGLGAARNAGTRLAVGRYLAFADSDDVVCPGAYEHLIGALESTGSDLAIGTAYRWEGRRTSLTPLMKENHRRDLLGVDLDDAPLLLADCFAWNKVFRRSFWDDAALGFPAGVRYEDQPTLTRALLAARSIDSLRMPVYLWRIRRDGSSISQQRGDLADLADRVVTKRWSTSYVEEQAGRAVRDLWYRRILPVDLPEYLRRLPDSSPAYRSMLAECLREFWSPATVPLEEVRLPREMRDLAVALRDAHAVPVAA